MTGVRPSSRQAPFLGATVLLIGLLYSPYASAENKVNIVHGNSDGYPFESNVAFPAGEYYALRCERTCELKKTSLQVRGATIDGYDGQLPGFMAQVPKGASSLFLVRGLPNLKEGPVTTWYFNERFQKSPWDTISQEWKSAQDRAYDIDGKSLSITGLLTRAKPADCQAGADCPSYPLVRWRVRYGEMERTIATLRGDEMGTPIPLEDFVVWVGDLDGDGKPDLVVRPQNRSDYLELSLFLSSTLVPGKPWRTSGHFYYWDPKNPGC